MNTPEPDSNPDREIPVYSYDASSARDSDESEPPAAPTPIPCPDCGGAGSICLLISRKPCTRCRGTGRIDPPTQILAEPEPGQVDQTPVACETYRYTFDEENRLVKQEILYPEGQWEIVEYDYPEKSEDQES